MAHSFANVLLHIVFSTKDRVPLIPATVAPHLYGYIAGICSHVECPSHAIGGMPDHIHIACSLSRVENVSRLIKEIKVGSSKWMKVQGVRSFAWQGGYGAFSFSESQRSQVMGYIANQLEHHRIRTFQEELRALLQRHKVPFDERYVWE